VVHGAGDGGCDAGKTDLSYSAGAERVQHLVRIVEESDVDFRGVRVGGDDVVGEIVVDGHSETRVVDGFLKECHANTHDDRTLDLVASRLGIENMASIDYCHHARDTQTSGLRLPGHLCELRSERVLGVLAIWRRRRDATAGRSVLELPALAPSCSDAEPDIGAVWRGAARHAAIEARIIGTIALGLLEKTVADEELRRKLTPDHPMGCKRLVFSSDYLPALTRPNVEVVNSPARYLKARSLVTEDGTEREVDAVVCATGYAAADYLGQLDVSGEQGTTLREVWSEGAHAYFGMAVPEFPNFFMLYGTNTNVGSNSVIFMLEAQARYIVRALKYMRRKNKKYLCVRPSALAEFIAEIDRWMVGTVWTTQCSNYFRAANGRVVTQWPRSARSFWEMTRSFKAADYSFSSPAVKASAADGDAFTAATRRGQ